MDGELKAGNLNSLKVGYEMGVLLLQQEVALGTQQIFSCLCSKGRLHRERHMTWQPQGTVFYRKQVSKFNFLFLNLGLSLFQQKATYPWEADTFHKHALLVKKLFSTEK